jgi:hypothetical protein
MAINPQKRNKEIQNRPVRYGEENSKYGGNNRRFYPSIGMIIKAILFFLLA